MSQAVDSKVVELSFDNQQFEQGCQTSMSTLDKLKQALNFTGAKTGLDEVANTANKMNLGGLGGAIEAVQVKFSALDTIAMTALSNITNKAVNAGEQLVKAFTIDPVSDGFKEYELKMDSVQTIMAGTGADVETVNGYLNELNTYSDKTIYSFKDMTASIGKFTNAGVELGSAVDAIQGIANEAARSGANANEASRAMYNFSQALSTGSVKLIDWKSIENANMATVEFKQELIDTAVALGTVVKDGEQYVTTTTNLQGKVSGAFDAVSDFNGSLAHQWLTSEVLTEALSHYAKNVEEMTQAERETYEEGLRKKGFDEDQIARIEQLGIESSKAATEVKTFSMMMDALKEAVGSGWAQTFEIIFGDLDEAKEMWTAVNNVLGGLIDSFSTARNTLLEGWDALGGRTLLLIGVSNAFKALVSVVKPIKEAFQDIFPPATAKSLVDITTRFAQFTKRLILSDTAMENLKNTFRGIFAVVSLVVKAFGLLTKAIFPAQSASGGLLSIILSVTGTIGNLVANTIQWVEQSGILQSVISGIASVAVPVFNTIKQVATDAFNAIKGFLSDNLSMPDFSKFNDAGDVFGYVSDSAKTLIDKVPSIEEMGNKIKEAFEKIKGSLGGAKEKGAAGIDKVAGMFNSLLGGKPEELKEQAKQSTKSFGEGIMEGLATIDVEKVLSGAKLGLFVYIVAQIAGILKNIRQLTGGFKKAAGELKKIPKQVTGILDKVKGTMVSMQNDIRANILLKVAIAIALLTASIIALTMVDSQKLANVAVDLALVIGVVAILAAVIGNIINKKGEGEDENPLVGVLDKFLNGIQKAAKKAMSVVSKAAAFTLVAAAIGILVAAFLKLAKMKDDLNGVVAATILIIGISVLLVRVVKYLNQVSDKIDAKTGVAIFLIANAIAKLAKSFMMLATLNFSQVVMGGLALAGIMTMFRIFATAISKADLSKAGAGLGILTLAILALTPVIILLGSLSEVAMAGVVVVGLLGLVMTGLAALSGVIGDKFGDKMLKGVGAMALLGLTITLLAPTLMLLGAAAPVAGKGILVLAGALAVLLVAGAVAGIPAVTEGLIALSATLVSFGASMLMAGAGVMLFATGLQILLGIAMVVITGIIAIVAGIKASVGVIGDIAQSIVDDIVNLGSFIGELIMALGPIIFEKIEQLFAMLPGWLMSEFPKIVAGIIALGIRIAVTALNMLASIQALIAGALAGLWDGIVQGIATAAGPIGEAIKGIFMGFINLIIDGLGGLVEKIPGIGDDLKKSMDDWRTSLFEKLKPEEGKEAMEGYTEGMAQGATEGGENVKETMMATMDDAMVSMEDKIKEGDEYGKKFMRANAQGILDNKSEVTDAAETTSEEMMNKLTEGTDGASAEFIQKIFGDMGGDISSMQPQLSGDMSEMLNGAFGDAAGSIDIEGMFGGTGENIMGTLAGSVDGSAGEFFSSMSNAGEGGLDAFNGIFAIASPSRVMQDNGKNIDRGLVNGVKQGQNGVNAAFRNMATKALQIIKQQNNKFKAAGVQAASMFAAGIRTSAGAVSAAARYTSSSASDGFSGGYNQAYRQGQNVGDGYAAGIRSKISAVRAAARDLSNAGHVSTSKNDDSHSPSRVYRKFGNFVGDGYILGIRDRIKGVGKIARDMSQSAIKATRTPLKHIDAILGGEMNLDPTIRPVMDLSDIQEGARLIDSLMPNSSVGLSFAASGAVNGASFRATNDDVVAAVNSLRSELKNMPRGDNITTINGVTYDDGSNINSAVRDIVRAARIERRA